MENYPASVRQFAVNLHAHSSRAYEFVRATFDDNLPHHSTLRRWYTDACQTTVPTEATTTKINEKSLETIGNGIAQKEVSKWHRNKCCK